MRTGAPDGRTDVKLTAAFRNFANAPKEIFHTVYKGFFLVCNQLDAQFFFMYVYFNSLHVSGGPRWHNG